ncbi:MAG: prolyl oligopeptidase family serine peptidase [Myxococcota bacterium]|nr:prolyl oligopeptidase family serine peptidase [Myxococcota bacterium]
MRSLALTTVGLAACAGPSRSTGSVAGSVPPAAAGVASGSSPPAPSPSPSPALPYPVAPRVERSDVLHGVRVEDPYRWLEDGKDPRVRRWADEEDALARAYLAKLPGREAIAARLKELSYVENEGTPRHLGDRWFYPRREAGKEKYAVYWRQGKPAGDGARRGRDAHGAADPKEKVLLDPNAWSTDGSVSLGVWSVSWDGKTVAYTTKSNNSDEATLCVMDVATGKKSAVDVIEGAKYAWPSWTPSGDGFYYTWLPDAGSVPTADRPAYAEVRFHKLGTGPARDRTVRGRTGDPTTFLGAELSKDGRWLILSTEHGWTRTDVEFLDLHAAAPAWTPLAVGQDARYSVEVDRDRFFVRTNEGAPRYRVFKVSPVHPERTSWAEIVPERADATLEGFSVVGHALSLAYLKDVVSQLEIRDEDGKLVREVALPPLGTSGGLSGNVDDDLAYYTSQSFTFPTEIAETNVRTGVTSTFYKLGVPVDPSQVTVERLFATSRDGTRVPFFVVHAGNTGAHGARSPTILYGYGGFQAAQTPTFSPSIYPWLERGGNWVVANLRGGSEYGEEWHRHGMLHEKQHVFDDFIAVAEELARQGFARADKLAALGGSNGGLLVGAAITQRPDLFRVALCGVPLLDMVRYHLVGSGKTWIAEYGVSDVADDFRALFAYSPYHHVARGTKYPATLILSADSDDRVDPMHARKFAAELQWASSGGPVLLRIEKNSGHGGADLVRASVEKLADEYAFALNQMRD